MSDERNQLFFGDNLLFKAPCVLPPTSLGMDTIDPMMTAAMTTGPPPTLLDLLLRAIYFSNVKSTRLPYRGG